MNRFLFNAIFVISGVATIMASDNVTITGTVRYRRSETPVEYATVSLYQADKGEMISGLMTDRLGAFMFDNIQEGTYFLKVHYIGSEPVYSGTVHVGQESSINVGTLYMDDGSMLSEVVVEGHKLPFVPKLDRKVYDVGQDLMSTSGSASDLMQNIPSVDVDMDGAVTLRGSENVTILINGKPSAMMGMQIRGDVLNQLPASSIERVEIITNPSAEYKPDGDSGIINIVLKKNADAGFNCAMTANIGSYNRQNTGINMNYGFRNSNFFAGYAYRRDRYDRRIMDHRVSPGAVIDQETYGLGRPISHTMRLGMNIMLTDKDLIELSGSYNRRRFRRNETVESETRHTDDMAQELYMRNRNAFAVENIWEATLRYSHSYGDSDELGVDYTYSSESEDEINHYLTMRSNISSMNDETVWDANYLHVARISWRHRLADWIRLVSGYEFEYMRTEQNYHVADWNGIAFIENATHSSDFSHCLSLNTLHTTMECNFGEWNLLAGVRGEYADIQNKLISADKILTQHYFNVYPTLHISRHIGTVHELMLSYAMRVNRPDGRDMNPFAEQINPLSLEAGNPYLHPEKIQSVELGWLWQPSVGGSLMSSLYYKVISNKITEVSRYTESGVLLTTKENMQSGQNAGLELIWSLPLYRWIDFNIDMNGYYNRIDALKLGFENGKDTFSWSALLNVNVRPIRHGMVQLNTRYRSATLVPQGKRDGDFRVNIGVKYDIPKINLSIIASVTDLFDTYKKSYTLDTPALKQKVEKRRNPRIFYIGATWQFGTVKKRDNAKLEYDEGL